MNATDTAKAITYITKCYADLRTAKNADTDDATALLAAAERLSRTLKDAAYEGIPQAEIDNARLAGFAVHA